MKRTLFVGAVIVSLSFLYIFPAQGFESSPIGWASLDDGNVPYNITGGSAGATVTVSDPNSFKNYATSPLPYVILVSGTITMPRGTSSSDHPQTVDINSNKTIIGIGYSPGLNGGLNISGKKNIIIRNIKIWYEDSSQGTADPWTDGITMQNDSNHIWVDHCNIFDSPDGLCDPTKQSNYITISWCKFYYEPNSQNTGHRMCCLVGSSDTDYADRGKLKETWHHNWWTTNCKERMPRVRFGQVHVFNNYYSALASGGYCHGVGVECQIKVENNYYNAVPLAWKTYSGTPPTGKIGWNSGNVFYNCSIPSGWTNDFNNMFVPPYSYTLNSGADINTIVPNGAGVDKLTPSPNPMTFSVAPHALDSSSIAMTAATAACPDGVQYLFTCTAGGGHSSGWQTSTSYTDSGLAPDTNYTYTVQTRNQTQTIFTGAASNPATARTQVGNQRSLETSATSGGTVTTPGIGTYLYDVNTDANIVATVVDANYHFANWTGTAVTAGKVTDPNAASTKVWMDANYTVIANFAFNQRSLTTSASAGGTVTTPGIGTYWYNQGTDANIVASANANYHFVNWTGTAVTAGKVTDPNGASTKVRMDANYAVQANFAIDPDITAPLPPANLTATSGYATVVLDWNDNNESDLAGYNVYRSATQGSGYSKLNSSLVSDSNYDDNSIPHNMTYYYVVTAVDTALNESNYSNEVFSGLYGDFSGNGIVEMNDLPDFLAFWLIDDCNETPHANIDENCWVSFYEFSVLADNWLKED
jgi:pectate lyase